MRARVALFIAPIRPDTRARPRRLLQWLTSPPIASFAVALQLGLTHLVWEVANWLQVTSSTCNTTSQRSKLHFILSSLVRLPCPRKVARVLSTLPQVGYAACGRLPSLLGRAVSASSGVGVEVPQPRRPFWRGWEKEE